MFVGAGGQRAPLSEHRAGGQHACARPCNGRPGGSRKALLDDPMRQPRFRQTTPQLLDTGEPIPPEWDLRSNAWPTPRTRSEPIPPEWDLHCGACGYNLTGLTARRCPECGEPFKPRELWSANRLAAIEAQEDRVPLYMSYGLVSLFIAVILWKSFIKPYILLPFLLLLLYELLTRQRGRGRARARVIVLALCGVLALAIWFTW